jgi:hypothetical protein
MEDNTIVIRKNDKKKITLVFSEKDNEIILSRKNDKSNDRLKKQIIIESMPYDDFKNFVEIEIKEPSFFDKVKLIIKRRI